MSQILDGSAGGGHHLHWPEFRLPSGVTHIHPHHAHHVVTVAWPTGDEELLPHQLHLEQGSFEWARMGREMGHL